MTPFAMAWRRIVRRPAAALLSMLLVALGVAAVAATLLVVGQVDRAAERNAAAADLVIGAKTSPMQLVLAGIFHLDAPPAPFDVRQLEPALRNPVVRQWVPLALGDSVDGFRVVGTQPADFTALYGGVLAQGHWPQAEGEAVLGAEVARATGLVPDARFATTHGLAAGGQAHTAQTNRVAGVLARTGTVLDKLVLTRLETVWNAHAGAGPSGAAPAAQGKVSLVLVKFRSPLGAVVFPRLLGFAPGLQVALPAQEAAKLYALVQIGADGSLLLGALLLSCAALAVCAGLLAAQRERTRDVAVLRLLGAPPRTTAAMLLTEAGLIGVLGAAAGLAMAHLAVELVARQLPAAAPPLTGFVFEPLELSLVVAAVAIAWAGAALPAWRVHRTVVADVLKAA